MSGSGLQDRLIADGYRTPIIFMTAYFDEKIRARALKAGAFGFLRKPFADESLIESLDKALEAPDCRTAAAVSRAVPAPPIRKYRIPSIFITKGFQT